MKHKVFISFNHEEDQWAKDELLKLNKKYEIFEDYSVHTNDIDDNLTSERIRQIIRDEYLRDSTVTILLVGIKTKERKHIDWELKSSMINSSKNKKSGILVVQLPSVSTEYITAAHGTEEKDKIYSGINSWVNVTDRKKYNERYPYLPERIIDNLLKDDALISVTTWDRIINPEVLRGLIELTFKDREKCIYDLSREMKRRNS